VSAGAALAAAALLLAWAWGQAGEPARAAASRILLGHSALEAHAPPGQPLAGKGASQRSAGSAAKGRAHLGRGAESPTPLPVVAGLLPTPDDAIEPSPEEADATSRDGRPGSGERALSIVEFVGGGSGPSLSAVGHDRAGPRLLTLWRVDPANGRAIPVAAGASDSSGQVRFETWPRPPGAVELVATPRGRLPDAAGASAPVELPERPAPPPVVEVREVGRAWQLTADLLPGATLLIREPEGKLRRIAGGPTARRVRLALAAPVDGAPLAVAQETSAGEWSDWRLAAPVLKRAASPATDPSRIREGDER